MRFTKLVAACLIPGSAFAAGVTQIPYTTPPGVTLVDVTGPGSGEIERFLWKRFGDEGGKSLYTYDADGDKGRATCVNACAVEFPPFLAAPDAKASGEWSLVKSGSGKQWAYLGQPLYRYSGKEPTREAAEAAGKPAGNDPSGAAYSPKAGWRQATFTPEKIIRTPPGIELQSLATAGGYGFAAPSGMPLYSLSGAPRSANAWVPVYAPGLALTIGDFKPVQRTDGTLQWAYKGGALYTFSGDYSPSDINGLAADSGASIVLAYREFMPDSIAIQVVPTRGPIMVTHAGLSLYTESRQHLQYGGRETRQGYHFSYSDAKAVGTRGCVKDCTSQWHPVIAPADAKSWGAWEVAVRDDGVRQWSYKGSPLYTYVADKSVGDIEGNNRHVIIFGDLQGKTDLSITGGDKEEPGNNYAVYGSGLYWHLVTLMN